MAEQSLRIQYVEARRVLLDVLALRLPDARPSRPRLVDGDARTIGHPPNRWVPSLRSAVASFRGQRGTHVSRFKRRADRRN